MSANRDRLAKCVLEEVLDPFGTTQREVEIEPGYLQRGDFLFTPHHPLAPENGPGYLRLVRRMVEEISLFEFSSNSPDEEETLDFHCKQMSLRNRRRQKGEEPPMPRLWVLSAHKPVTALAALSAEADPEFGAGFYRLTRWTRMRIVVLPDSRATGRRWCCACWGRRSCERRRCERSRKSPTPTASRARFWPWWRLCATRSSVIP